MTEKMNNTPRDLFNKSVPLPRMPVEDYFLFNMLSLTGQGFAQTADTQSKVQQELFPISIHDRILDVLMPGSLRDNNAVRPVLFEAPHAMGRKEFVDYMVLEFTKAADKQVPLFSEEDLPSATSLKNFMGAPKGYCPSDQETSAKQRNPSRRP